LGCPKGNGSRLKVQGTRKNIKRKVILALCLKPLLPAKAFNADLVLDVE
jgi:hypothetical protein